MNIREYILQLLNADKTKAKLDDLRKQILADPIPREGLSGFPWFEDAAIESASHPAQSRPVRRSFFKHQSELLSVAQSTVVDKLPFPPPILAEEIVASFGDHLLVRDEEFTAAYHSFVGGVIGLVGAQSWAGPIAVAGVCGDVFDLLGDLREYSDPGGAPPLWSFFHGHLDWCTWGPPVDAVDNHGTHPMLAWVAFGEGVATDGAVGSFMKQVGFVVPSIITSTVLVDGESPERLTNLLPYVLDYVSAARQPFFHACMTGYLDRPPRRDKDSMKRRVRNAIHLLAVADRQTDEAVGLALCCASMEALVCQGTQEVATSLSERAAMLLERERLHRPDAKKFFKDLYTSRSKLLHGEKVNVTPGQPENARYLSAELLRAVIERIDFMGRSGFDPERPDNFFSELDGLWDRGCEEVPGVSPPSRMPWRVP